MAAAEEELVRRLRHLQEAYEHDTSSSGGKHLCSTILSLGSHISSVPDFLLCPDLPFDLFWEECVRELIQISAPEQIEIAMCNMYHARELLWGLLRLMAANCGCESPFSNPKCEEASLTKLHILLRLTLERNEDGELPLTIKLFPMWSTIKNSILYNGELRSIRKFVWGPGFPQSMQ